MSTNIFDNPDVFCTRIKRDELFLPLQIKGFWDIGGSISDCGNFVTRAMYYDILQYCLKYDLEQLLGEDEWLPSSLIFNRSDRQYRVVINVKD